MKTLLQIALLTLLLLPLAALAQEDGDKAKKDEAPKTIAELTENHDRYEGLLTLLQDQKTGDLKLLIPAELLDQELVYFAQASDGVVQTGYFRGAYLANGVIALRRHFDKIEVVELNTNFYFDPDSALSRASEANISDAILATEKILAEDEQTGAVLINGNDLFVSEALLQIKPSPDPDADPKAFKLGSLAGAKSKLIGLRSYPQNTDVEVQYVYSDAAPSGDTGPAITDRRNVAVKILHSFIEMPDNDFTPRYDDPRVGYFSGYVTDLTSLSPTPYRDPITRWHLKKKDPSAAVSDPVEPITFWIENTTPVELRDTIRRAALEWNQSFEKAGFSNAVVVEVQPDDADWDAGDIRYNVLRWTSSPNPPFGGYGPSFVNPRTGQILGADIMLEYSFLGRFDFMRRLMSSGASIVDTSLPAGLRADRFCMLADGLRSESMVARSLAMASGGDLEDIDQQLLNDSLHYLILHEIGHTLGLNHNMKATQLRSIDEAFDREALADGILAGSVMDYPAVNYAPDGEPQTLFYSVAPGPYDDWAIRFGYAPEMDDPAARAALLARSTEPELAFGNDADDMRAPGKAIDPLVNIYDMSDDAIGYADLRMQQIAAAFAKLPEAGAVDGESYQRIHDGFVDLMRGWARSAGAVSRYVGGVHVSRAMVDQQGGQPPYTPVDAVTQQRAMQVLAERVFAPDVADVAEPTYRYLAQQRRGFNFFGQNEDPKIHAAVLSVQSSVLDHLLHPSVLQRLTDSALYGNEYTMAQAMNELTDAVFEADARGSVNTIRQNLQVNYVERLAKIAGGEGYDNLSQSMAILKLQDIQRLIERKRGMDVATRAHVAHLNLLIERALSTDA